MKITCMGCQNYEFEIKILDFELEETLQVSLKCHNCNKRTLIEPLHKGGRSISFYEALNNSSQIPNILSCMQSCSFQ